MKYEFDPNKPAVPVTYPRLLLDLMIERGISAETVLAGTQITPQTFYDPEKRLSPAQFLAVILNCFYLSKDPALGYELGLRTPVTSHGFLGYAVMSCSTLREAIELAVRFIRLRSALMTVHLYEEGDDAVVEANSNYPVGALRMFIYESLLVSLVRAGSFITGNTINDSELHFDFAEPLYYAQYKQRLPPTFFNRGANQLRFPKKLLNQPLVMADPVAARLAVAQCERELSLLQDEVDFPVRVRALLVRHEDGYPHLESVAEQLFMSARTLKRRLQQHNLSFRELLDESRRRDAVYLLTKHQLTIEQVALQLGYSDSANFVRAFRKWTGTTPSLYRHQHTLTTDSTTPHDPNYSLVLE